MEVILLEKIHNLGKLGDKVRVRPGYGRNYLIPRKMAVPATPDNITRFEAQRAELERTQQDALDAATARAARIGGLEVAVVAKAGAEGRLYGSVGAQDICDAVEALGHSLDKREVRLPNGPLRMLGRHDVTIHLHADIDTTITVVIGSEDAVPEAASA